MAAKNSGEKTDGRKNKPLNPRQQKFVKTLAKGACLTDAAIEAGYSSRNPGQSGFQALRQIRGRVPDLLERHGLGEEELIEKYLKPLLGAKRTLFFQKDGKVKQKVEVEASEIRLSSLRTAFELHGSYAPRDPKEAEQFGIKVVVVDIPGPPRNAIDVTPAVAGANSEPSRDDNGYD
jgi:hypothetical protein